MNASIKTDYKKLVFEKNDLSLAIEWGHCARFADQNYEWKVSGIRWYTVHVTRNICSRYKLLRTVTEPWFRNICNVDIKHMMHQIVPKSRQTKCLPAAPFNGRRVIKTYNYTSSLCPLIRDNTIHIKLVDVCVQKENDFCR